jgi:hypothetical protein
MQKLESLANAMIVWESAGRRVSRWGTYGGTSARLSQIAQRDDRSSAIGDCETLLRSHRLPTLFAVRCAASPKRGVLAFELLAIAAIRTQRFTQCVEQIYLRSRRWESREPTGWTAWRVNAN